MFVQVDDRNLIRAENIEIVQDTGAGVSLTVRPIGKMNAAVAFQDFLDAVECVRLDARRAVPAAAIVAVARTPEGRAQIDTRNGNRFRTMDSYAAVIKALGA